MPAQTCAVNSQQCAEQPPGPRAVFPSAWYSMTPSSPASQISEEPSWEANCLVQRGPEGRAGVLLCWNCTLSRLQQPKPQARTSDDAFTVIPRTWLTSHPCRLPAARDGGGNIIGLLLNNPGVRAVEGRTDLMRCWSEVLRLPPPIHRPVGFHIAYQYQVG